MSATADHFSMMATRLDISLQLKISEATIRLTSLKRLVMSRMWCAFVSFSDFIQAIKTREAARDYETRRKVKSMRRTKLGEGFARALKLVKRYLDLPCPRNSSL